ncbi:MAG: hypothetical protein IPN90_01720 [Elusimicrobia bacterium]|nr:hypothetical protein [Elusimicrobiota bacterium]
MNIDNSLYSASDTSPFFTGFFINAVNRIDMSIFPSESVVFSTTFTSHAAPPVLLPSVSPFSTVEPRSISLRWDSDTMNGVTPYPQNPLGTTYEVQLATSASFISPIVQMVIRTGSPDKTTVSCLSPETRYYARVRAINLEGIPTAFLSLGSTVTLSAGPVPTVYSWAGARWGLSLATGEIPDEGALLFNSTPLVNPMSSPGLPEKILAANSKMEGADLRRRPIPDGLVEIQASRGCPVIMDAVLDHPATLIFDVTSLESGADTGYGRVRLDTLSFFRLDAGSNVWNKVPSWLEGGKLKASVKELGTLAVMGREDVSLFDLRVFPNPFRQNTDPYVTFANLAERATLQILTSSGREVRRLEEEDGDGILLWDGRNSSGHSVEPGVYVFHVESPGAEKNGKMMVLR